MDIDTDKSLVRGYVAPEFPSDPSNTSTPVSIPGSPLPPLSATSVTSPNRPDFHADLGRGISEEDKLLARRDKSAVDFVFNYAKLWCKFIKDLQTGLEKRATYENDSAKNIVRQFQSMESGLTSMVGAPLRVQSINLSKMLVDHCRELETHNNKRCRELLEVVNRQRTEFERARKHLKEKWKMDLKRMVDAETNMFKTKQSYHQRCQAGVKLREELSIAEASLTEMTNAPPLTSGGVSPGATVGGSGAGMPSSGVTASGEPTHIAKQKLKVDKLMKQLRDNDNKEMELMYSYRETVETANLRLQELEKSKVEIVCDIRLTTSKSDEVVKDTMAEYLTHLHATRLGMLKQYESLAQSFQEYQPCQEYRQLLEVHTQKLGDNFPDKFQFDPFHDTTSTNSGCPSTGSGVQGKDRLESQRGASVRYGLKEGPDSPSSMDANADTESDTEDPIISLTSSTTAAVSNRSVLNQFIEFGSNLFRPDPRKRSQALGKRSTTEGPGGTGPGVGGEGMVYPTMTEKEIEAAYTVVARCAMRIEEQETGLTTHGIYRVPASRVKVSNVMESLTTSPDEANLTDEQPLTLASVLKSRLILLPEPLLPYNLYPNFVEIGKEAETGISEDLLRRLASLIEQLTPASKRLAGLIFHHLRRVADCQTENQMGSANLGTLFGPTLLRPRPKFRNANMMEFVDNKPQTKVVELIIDNVELLFGAARDYYPGVGTLTPADTTDATEQQQPIRTSLLLTDQQQTPPIRSLPINNNQDATSSNQNPPVPLAKMAASAGHQQQHDASSFSSRLMGAGSSLRRMGGTSQSISQDRNESIFDLDDCSFIDGDTSDDVGNSVSSTLAHQKSVTGASVRTSSVKMAASSDVSVQSRTVRSASTATRRSTTTIEESSSATVVTDTSTSTQETKSSAVSRPTSANSNSFAPGRPGTLT